MAERGFWLHRSWGLTLEIIFWRRFVLNSCFGSLPPVAPALLCLLTQTTAENYDKDARSTGSSSQGTI
jgi:hypothetical protein